MSELTRDQIGQLFSLELATDQKSAADLAPIVDGFLDLYDMESYRKYHVVSHLGDMASFLTGIKDRLNNPRVVFGATLGHDSVFIPWLYNPAIRAGLNEELSAQLTEAVLGTILPEDEIKLIGSYIRRTAKHEWDGKDKDLGYFLDSDMLILASEDEVFDIYDENVGKEFSFAGNAFKGARKGFFSHLLTVERIFNMDDVFEEYEGSAKANIARKLDDYDKE